MDRSKALQEIARLKRQFRAGDSAVVGNIAAIYRQVGDNGRAYEWWRRAAGPTDGDSWVEVGFCRQYGIGTRADRASAIRAYRQAIRTYFIAAFGFEEAAYHLAIALLDRGRPADRREAEAWLERAGEDRDYPQASKLLAQLRKGDDIAICRCRRGLRASLGGKQQCRMHGGRSNTRVHPTAAGRGAERPRLNRGR
jgi:TPR repeat protein